MPVRILIVEDDLSLSEMLGLHFLDQGFTVDRAGDCAEARDRLSSEHYDLMLLDQQLPDGLGMDLLASLGDAGERPAVIMMTGQHDLELAIDAIKTGAAEFVHKPVRTDELQRVASRLLDARRQAKSAAALESGPGMTPVTRELIGKSAAMLRVSKEIALSAASDASVLITGESGTGKEVVARLIHQHSGRSGAFVAVNCAAIVDTLLESELFGHEKGAFTGALARKPGRFELAQDGTLFLDEVGELALPLQAKLLRALQERVFERVGGTQPLTTNARVIAATNRDLVAAAREGRFREDLIYRLNVVSIHVPPLRERREDIPLLVRAILARIVAAQGKGPIGIGTEALRLLEGYDWPGNVRELENQLTQAVVHCRSGIITPDLITPRAAAPASRGPARELTNGRDAPPDALRSLDDVEAEHIQRVLDHTGGHKARTCQILGISRPALDRKIAKYGLRVPGR
jgi:two-component system response regulator AtoC